MFINIYKFFNVRIKNSPKNIHYKKTIKLLLFKILIKTIYVYIYI